MFENYTIHIGGGGGGGGRGGRGGRGMIHNVPGYAKVINLS